MNEAELIRSKMLGVLIRDARNHAGHSVADCAKALKISTEKFVKAEQGEYPLSLPEMEVLAIFLKVPINHFWGSQALEASVEPDFDNMLALRQRIVGALLRQARIEAGRSLQELAAAMEVDQEQAHRFEMGQEAIPVVKLEKVARYLGYSLDYFSDGQRGPLARHEAEVKMQRYFDEMPPEVKEFVCKPINMSYLETAIQLSEMDVNRLRRIAEGILDITF